MVKGKKAKLKVSRLLVKGVRTFGKAFDGSAQWVADRAGPKPAKQRRASVEWTSKPGGKGERISVVPQRGLIWGVRQTVADKEWWRVSFIAGPTQEFLTWPPRDHEEACKLAREHVVKKYGVFAESWEIGVVEFARKDEQPEEFQA